MLADLGRFLEAIKRPDPMVFLAEQPALELDPGCFSAGAFGKGLKHKLAADEVARIAGPSSDQKRLKA